MNEAGDSVPGSQDSITQGVQNLQLTATAPPHVTSSHSTTADAHLSKTSSAEGATETGIPSLCSMWFISTGLRWNLGPRGLMVHMVQKLGGQQLIQESVAQLRQLDRAACVLCDTILVTAKVILQPETSLLVTPFQDRRPPGHQDAALVGCPTAHHPPHSPQPVPPHSGHRYHRTRLAAARRSSQSLSHGHPALHSLSLRPRLGQEALREPSVATSPASCYVDIAAASSDRNVESKNRLQLWEADETSELFGRVLGLQHSGPLRSTKRVMQPQN